MHVASECVTFFDCSVSDANKSTALRKHCKLFEKYIIGELDIVHGHLFS